MSETKDTEIRSKYDDFTVEELTEELKNVFFCSSQITGKEVAEIEQLLDILRQRDPLPGDAESEDLWGRFLEVHGDEFAKLGIRNTEEVVKKEAEAASVKLPDAAVITPVEAPAPVQERGFRKQLHTAMIAAAVVAVMVIVTVSASAAGINIWGWVPVWNEGSFRYVLEDSVPRDIPIALKQNGVDELLFPTWLPDGFILYEQQVHFEEPLLIHAAYFNKDRVVLIYIHSVPDRDKFLAVETDDESFTSYYTRDIEHKIYTNMGQIVCTWISGNYHVKVSGDITEEEMKKIIDSVYEVIE